MLINPNCYLFREFRMKYFKNISDSENNNIINNNVDNVMNRSIGENRVNISNFLNNEYINICMK